MSQFAPLAGDVRLAFGLLHSQALSFGNLLSLKVLFSLLLHFSLVGLSGFERHVGQYCSIQDRLRWCKRKGLPRRVFWNLLATIPSWNFICLPVRVESAIISWQRKCGTLEHAVDKIHYERRRHARIQPVRMRHRDVYQWEFEDVVKRLEYQLVGVQNEDTAERRYVMVKSEANELKKYVMVVRNVIRGVRRRLVRNHGDVARRERCKEGGGQRGGCKNDNTVGCVEGL
ncbi:MAG: hypothetical protein Q9191_004377 [Dirinaria sp. TL-2023a]